LLQIVLINILGVLYNTIIFRVQNVSIALSFIKKKKKKTFHNTQGALKRSNATYMKMSKHNNPKTQWMLYEMILVTK
jgi:hypothetical protein